MNNLARRGLLLLALGLLARPAWALGDQLDVFIYWALSLAGLLALVGLVLLGRLRCRAARKPFFFWRWG